jgi:NADH-quinone oxidoreductase subunit N
MRVVIEAFGGQEGVWQQIVIFVALASILLGAVAAIGQSNIKRLLAYSSINNVGFILIGLAVATPEGAAAMMTYLIIYVAMTLGSFICVMDMEDKSGRPVENIANMSGLSKTRPGLAAAMAIFMFSLAGIPPLFGFWGKFVVFDAAVQGGLISLAAIGIAASVIGAFYYLKVVKVMYFDEACDVVQPSSAMERTVLIALAALFMSPLGYLTTLALAPITADAARSLFAGL